MTRPSSPSPTDPAGEALIDVQVLGSVADIDDVRWGQARTNGTTNDPDPDPDRATPAQLALPVDDDLSAALRALEETLLALLDPVADARPAADTAGRLAALVDPDRSNAVRPTLGLTELIPLALPLLPRPDVDQLVAVASSVIAPNAPDDVAETMAEMAAAARPRNVAATWADTEGEFRSEITAVLAVIQVDHSDDLDALARLYQPVPESRRSDKSGQETVMLTAPETRCRRPWRSTESADLHRFRSSVRSGRSGPCRSLQFGSRARSRVAPSGWLHQRHRHRSSGRQREGLPLRPVPEELTGSELALLDRRACFESLDPRGHGEAVAVGR